MSISNKDKNQLVDILSKKDFAKYPDSLELLLTRSDLDDITISRLKGKLDRGKPEEAMLGVINSLIQQGEDESGSNAISRFLNILISQDYKYITDKQEIEFIRTLVKKTKPPELLIDPPKIVGKYNLVTSSQRTIREDDPSLVIANEGSGQVVIGQQGSKHEIIPSIEERSNSRSSEPRDPTHGYIEANIMIQLDSIRSTKGHIQKVRHAVNVILGLIESNDKNTETLISSMLLSIIDNFKNTYSDMIRSIKDFYPKTWENISDIHNSIALKINELEKCFQDIKGKSIDEVKSALKIITSIEELSQALPIPIISTLVAYSGANIHDK